MSLKFVTGKKETVTVILESDGIIKYTQSGQLPIKKMCEHKQPLQIAV